MAAYVEAAFLGEGLEEAVEEDLGVAFLVAGDVFCAPVDEFGEALFAVEVGHV